VVSPGNSCCSCEPKSCLSHLAWHPPF
jgi:hypothetical protein